MRERGPENPASRPIGVFDSGLGGLTVVREILQALPGEDIVYLGDTARVPYGIKSLATVRRFASEDAAFLLGLAPKMLVAACNTASAAGLDHLRERSGVDVVDVITPGAAAAVAQTDGAIAVIATEATIASGAYTRAIHALDPARAVHTSACPLLAPIVEEGRDETDPIVTHVLCDYLRDLQRIRPGALILGCTHYPLLAGAIGKLMGPETVLVSSASAAAMDVRRRLQAAGMVNQASSPGKLMCWTTDSPGRFATLGERFVGGKIDHVEFVATDELEAVTQTAAR